MGVETKVFNEYGTNATWRGIESHTTPLFGNLGVCIMHFLPIKKKRNAGNSYNNAFVVMWEVNAEYYPHSCTHRGSGSLCETRGLWTVWLSTHLGKENPIKPKTDWFMVMDFMIPIGMLTIHISKVKSKEVLRDEEFSDPSPRREKKFEKFSAIVRSYTEIKSVRICKRDVLQECNKDCVNIRQNWNQSS